MTKFFLKTLTMSLEFVLSFNFPTPLVVWVLFDRDDR